MKSLLTPGIFLAAIAAAAAHGAGHAQRGADQPTLFMALGSPACCSPGDFTPAASFSHCWFCFCSNKPSHTFLRDAFRATRPGRIGAGRSWPAAASQFCAALAAARKRFYLSHHRSTSFVAVHQSVIVAVLCRPSTAAAPPRITLLRRPRCLSPRCWHLLPRRWSCSYDFLLFHKPTESGLFWALAACFLALRFRRRRTHSRRLISPQRRSFLREPLSRPLICSPITTNSRHCLRGAPSMRAAPPSSRRIPLRWWISIISNAATTPMAMTPAIRCFAWWPRRLARVSGGGQAYRCGGEEFAIVFPREKPPAK